MTARSLNDKLKTVRDALTGIKDAKVYHYRRPASLAGCIVWSEEGDDGNYLYGDNSLYEQIITGYIEYWAAVEYDPMIDAIQTALNGSPEIGWRLREVTYMDDMELIFYAWDFSVI